MLKDFSKVIGKVAAVLLAAVFLTAPFGNAVQVVEATQIAAFNSRTVIVTQNRVWTGTVADLPASIAYSRNGWRGTLARVGHTVLNNTAASVTFRGTVTCSGTCPFSAPILESGLVKEGN
ncbi:MAG: hypothetical protein FWF59_00995 [Turicibacter sp.]|nr:hypothetical protein [Turicibacter sp.]